MPKNEQNTNTRFPNQKATLFSEIGSPFLIVQIFAWISVSVLYLKGKLSATHVSLLFTMNETWFCAEYAGRCFRNCKNSKCFDLPRSDVLTICSGRSIASCKKLVQLQHICWFVWRSGRQVSRFIGPISASLTAIPRNNLISENMIIPLMSILGINSTDSTCCDYNGLLQAAIIHQLSTCISNKRLLLRSSYLWDTNSCWRLRLVWWKATTQCLSCKELLELTQMATQLKWCTSLNQT